MNLPEGTALARAKRSAGLNSFEEPSGTGSEWLVLAKTLLVTWNLFYLIGSLIPYHYKRLGLRRYEQSRENYKK